MGIFVLHVLNLLLMHIALSFAQTGGPSASCVLDVLLHFLLQPLQQVHYLAASGHLWYAFQWHKSKILKDRNEAQLWCGYNPHIYKHS
jgi:hypothetical protein